MNLKKILMYIFTTAFVVSTFTLFCSCTKESGESKKLNIAVVNAGDTKGNINPITISVFIDEKPVGKNQVIKNDRPFILVRTLKKGDHTLRITEGATGAVFKTTVSMDRERWLRVKFYRESKSMGYFESKLQDDPWGYEFEKQGKKKEDEVKSRRKYEDEIDRKLDSLVEKNKQIDKKDKSGKRVKKKR